MEETDRLTRGKSRAIVKRTTVIANIRAIHAKAQLLDTKPELVPEYLVDVTDLDILWAQFRSEDESVLDYLTELDKLNEFSPESSAEVRSLVNQCKMVATKVVPKGAEVIDLAYLNNHLNVRASDRPPVVTSDELKRPVSRLPEIPLPIFNGDFKYWPTFRDRFKALVEDRLHLTAIDKMYYLIGCLQGPAADAVRGIPVSTDSYTLAWSTLSNKFNRSRMVPTSLVDNLLHAPSVANESLHELNSFTCMFSEIISLLNALKIPGMNSFILFSIAFRYLPITTRKLFESTNTSDFPSIDELLSFVHSRVAMLELVGEQPRKIHTPNMQAKSAYYAGQSRKGVDRFSRPQSSQLLLIVAKSGKACPCCTGSHVLDTCNRFKALTVDERVRCAREKRLCFTCLSPDHWSNKCRSKTKCHECQRRHHVLLHPPQGDIREKGDGPHSDASLCVSLPPRDSKSTSVILVTALVHARDRAGSWQTLRAAN